MTDGAVRTPEEQQLVRLEDVIAAAERDPRWLHQLTLQSREAATSLLAPVLHCAAHALSTASQEDAGSRPLLQALKRQVWTPDTLDAVLRLVSDEDDPRLRQQLLGLVLSSCSTEMLQPLREGCESLSRLLERGACDVWSAIRKDTARCVASIVFSFPDLGLIDGFIDSLLKIATGDDWKASDGALLSLDALVTKIKVEHIAKRAAPTQSTSVQELIKGPFSGQSASIVFHLSSLHRNLPQLPRSLLSRLKPALYRSLKHDQVSVRETAALCLAHFVVLCDDATRVLSFQEVISKLNRLTTTEIRDALPTGDDDSAELLDATEAEGLLDVLAKLLPSLSISFLVKHWALIFPTLERYVVHIASSVRQRSSLVIAALVELCKQQHQSRASAQTNFESSGSSQPELELLANMLMSLAKNDPDHYSICWQRLEGRLLSIDAVVSRLGKELVLRHVGPHGVCSAVTTKRHANANANAATTASAWLPSHAIAQATWSLNDDEKLEFIGRTTAVEGVCQWLKTHPASVTTDAACFWKNVLGGWLQQAQNAFESTQFELRRISRQLLPGLARLAAWLDELPQLLQPTPSAHLIARSDDRKDAAAAAAVTASTAAAWQWSWLRSLLLHIQFLRESPPLSANTPLLVNDVISRTQRFVVGIAASREQMERQEERDMEATVMSVEARVLLWLIGLTSEADDQLWLLSSAFSMVHEMLPPRFQRLAAATRRSTTRLTPKGLDDSATDRQLSIALVQLLPVIAKELRSRVWTMMHFETDEHVQLWWMTERMTLSWLASDDMFRWIAVDKASALTSLLLTLDTLLAAAPPDLSLAEVNLVLRTVRDASRSIPSLSEKNGGVVYSSVLQLLASTWRVADSSQDNKTQTTIVHQIADWVYTHGTTYLHSKAKASTAQYCEWDDDESNDKDEEEHEDPLSDKRTEVRPSSSLVDTDNSLETALTTTWSGQQLSSFQLVVQATLAVNGESSTSLRHLASQLRISS